jgi:hypothetical protein
VPSLTAILLGAVPLFLFGATALAIAETADRTEQAARFAFPQRYPRTPFAILIVASTTVGILNPSRADFLAVALISAALLGSIYMQHKLLSTFAYMTRFYLDPAHWRAGQRPKPHWRYQMQHLFLKDPEHLDALMLSMFKQHRTHEAFMKALANREFPPGYESLLKKRFWGNAFPSVEDLAVTVVPNELLNNKGKYNPGRSSEEIFSELRVLALADTRLFLDRWQYYWCLRNLNFIDKIIRRTFQRRTQLAVVASGILIFALGCWIEPSHLDQPVPLLGAITTGSLLWLLVTCGCSSLVIVGAFRGTGTFAISDPTEGENFDPLWNRVIQVGIIAFAISFLIYGVASPFLFEAKTLQTYSIDSRFIIYALTSLLFCGLVFGAHFVGVHRLMSKSRDNALARSAEEIEATDSPALRKARVDHFLELRQLRAWPIRSSVIAQLLAGIALPVAVQALLLYTGLKAK